jgi:hypothetical protein
VETAKTDGAQMSSRCDDLTGFYAMLDRLEQKIGGARKLADCSGRMVWPQRGVYFFREDGEGRTDTGSGPRIVRVGTHAVSEGSGTRLWTRLSQHKGQKGSGGGNHRGSVFRQLVGAALIAQNGRTFPTWGDRKKSRDEVRDIEHAIECEVSACIGRMPFLWLAINDAPNKNSLRSFIERNAIALLSNAHRAPLDPASPAWLGRHSPHADVKAAGLWNSDYVDDDYAPSFLDTFEQLVQATERAA